VPLKIFINAEEIANQLQQYKEELKRDIEEGVGRLASQTNEYVAEMAKSKIGNRFFENQIRAKPTLLTFLENLKYEEVSPGVHMISILHPAMWIEDGIRPNTDMKPGLLKGQPYKVIPLNKAKTPSQNTVEQQKMKQAIERHMKKDMKTIFSPGQFDPNNPRNKNRLERNPDGSPRLGRLHEFSLPSRIPGKGNTPIMNRINVYQTLTPTGMIKRDIVTFRTVKPDQAGKWIHPGYEGKHFLDDPEYGAYKYFMDTWEKSVLPSILKNWEMK
jgi:hypothetical protein